MGRMPRTISLFVIAAVIATASATASATSINIASAATCWNHTDLEKRFAGKVNYRRVQAGVVKLTLDPELSKVARTHSNAMKRRGEPFHSTLEQLASRVTRWDALAENVGAGITVKEVWRALTASAMHESNTVDPRFRYMGVGVATSGNQKYVTIVFEGTRNPGTTLAMPSC